MSHLWDSSLSITSVDQLIEDAEDLLRRLFPLCRSITGNGVRATLKILQETAHFDITEIPSGTVCYDWTVPDEWNIRDAFILDSSGNKIVDFQKNNLHIVNYSIPVDEVLSFEDLKPHLHTLPGLPDAVPYRTSYYHRDWGFCLSYNDFLTMERGERYHVRIDSGLKPGFLTLGDTCIGGTSGTEFLISTYCCHPSLANDNLSGIVLWALLLRELKARKMRHSYRFVIAPETIGAIAYLAQNEPAMRRVSGGFVITTVAGPGAFGYKQSFRGNSIIDRVVHRTFKELDLEYIPYSFDINGSDERQFSTPFYRIPTGTICKDKYYEYPYYHTSLDNLGFISAENLVKTLMLYLHSIEKLELDVTYRSLNPWCEPQLGKRGLFPGLGGQIKQNVTISPEPAEKKYRLDEQQTITQKDIDMMVWIMFESDGKTSILDIAERRDFAARDLFQTAERLRRHNLIDISPTGREMSGR